MISYRTIREGIASTILKEFKGWPIDDEQAFHLEGPAILVRLVDSSHVVEDARTVRRQMDFNVVYLAPHRTPTAQIYDTGLRLASLLQPHIAFGGRVITVEDVSTRLVGEDFQIDFGLDFYDALREEEACELMGELEFKLMLER